MPDKTTPSDQSVEDFLNAIPDDKRRGNSLELLRLMREATGIEPKLWGPSIVGFGTYHYVYESGREGDTMSVGFAPRKQALVLYGVLYYDLNADTVEQLGPHTAGKGCLYIPDLTKIDTALLTRMVTKAYRQRS